VKLFEPVQTTRAELLPATLPDTSMFFMWEYSPAITMPALSFFIALFGKMVRSSTIRLPVPDFR